MGNLFRSILIILLAFWAAPLRAEGRPVPMVAVAANFTAAMEKIVEGYEAASGIKVKTVYSSTGKLYAQIKMGAPYDLYLAADGQRPELLAEEGLCEAPFIYATGATVLWTGKNIANDEKSWRDALVTPGVTKIAISTPEIAPYGKSAITALEKSGLLFGIETKLVYGQNVAQAFQFAYHGSADLAFTAMSMALSEKGREGKYWTIPEAEPVVQKGCMVKRSNNRESIYAFLEFLKSEDAQLIMSEFGYKR